MPRCNSPCGKGYCSAPNQCTCNDGYEVNAQGTCAPKCPDGCQQGECVAPGQCACRPGFKLLDAKCLPFCERGCVNGDCVAPNTCTCTEGFTMDPTGTRCEPKCDQPCLNGALARVYQMSSKIIIYFLNFYFMFTGRCEGPNRCRCNSGYQNDENNPFRCVTTTVMIFHTITTILCLFCRCNPHCPGGCVNGVCSSPGLCLCNAGFVKDRSKKGSQDCVPHA